MITRKKKDLPEINNNLLKKFINFNGNDSLLEMDNLSLREFLYYLDRFYLKYRDVLNYDDIDTTFGIEIEIEKVKYENIKKIKLLSDDLNDKTYNSWKLKEDSSLNNGCEVNSRILRNTIECWQELKEVCLKMKDNGRVDKNSGGHIHIATQILENNRDYWLNFLLFWATYENIIYRFCYGEYLTPRLNINNFARPSSSYFMYVYDKLKGLNYITVPWIMSNMYQGRNYAVNFKNVRVNLDDYNKNTIEIRCPNSTLEPVVWQNYIMLLLKIFEYSKSSDFDYYTIISRNQKNEKTYNLKLKSYNLIYLEQALEMADLIFDKNEDKIYFLRQYLKSFETSKRILAKAKRFVL